MKQWFNVDKQGLGRQAEEQGKGRLVGELIQNALDEPGVTKISVTLALVSNSCAAAAPTAAASSSAVMMVPPRVRRPAPGRCPCP